MRISQPRRLLALACVAAFAGVSATPAEGRRLAVAAKTLKRPTVRPRAQRRPEPAADLLDATASIEEHLHLQRGDTLGRLLAARGVGVTEAGPWLAAAEEVYDLRQLRPRQGVSLRFRRGTHALEAIRCEIDDRTMLVFEKGPDGVVHAQRAALPYFTEVKGLAGSISRGLREDAAELGVPPRVVSTLADIFGWDLDVASDLRPGDEFRVLYENLWQTGAGRAEAGNVLGAQLVVAGKPLTAVFFEDTDGRGGYYRPSGEPLSRELLRYPLEFTEITSEFSLLRRHPILHIRRPHLGVDFAAPVGTPVRAVANGTISYSGWATRLGRCVRIDHASALESLYGHLARIATGIRPGTAVDRGQVIGYVGASGLATGPHLHFAIHRDGTYVDPLALTAAADPPIGESVRRAFDRVRQVVLRQLAALPKSMGPVAVSLSERDLRRE